MKKFGFISILILFMVSNSFSQISNKKWVRIEENSNTTIYIDENNINEINNQISVWSLTIYKNPSEKTEGGKLIGKVKTQYLINSLTKKFSEIGSIRYDETGRIIHEAPERTINPLKSNTPLKLNKTVSLLYEKADQFLRDGKVVSLNQIEEETKLVAEENTDKAQMETNQTAKSQIQKNRLKPAVKKNDQIKNEDRKEVEQLEEKEEINKKKKRKREPDVFVFEGSSKKVTNNAKVTYAPAKPIISEEAEKEEKNITNDIKKETKKPILIESKKETPPIKKEYDILSERNIEDNIFSDGDLYCVQLSSWKVKSKAIKQVNKYKRKDYKAFYTEAYIKKFKSTWYRVRIGYYSSLEEAKNIAKKIKLKR